MVSFYSAYSLFERLHTLCYLLGVVPENLKEVCGGEQLVSFYSANSLFERLHALCNLLGVVPENLKEVVVENNW